MKKKIVIGIILIIIYFLVKGFFLYYYNIDSVLTSDYDEVINNFEFKDSITIENKYLEDSNYLVFKNMKIRNDFKNFKEKVYENEPSNDFKRYMLYDEDNKVKAVFMLGKYYTNTYMLKNDPTFFDSRISNKEVSKVLNKNNINNDIELYNYLRANAKRRANIFTSIKKMREIYIINYLVAVMFPKVESLTKIEGDYEGFIYNLKDGKEIDILIGDNKYTFTFLKKDYFTDNYINELLNTVIIE